MDMILREDEIPDDLREFFEPVDFMGRKDILTIATAPFKGAHFATFPPKLVEPCILAGTSEVGHCPAILEDGTECGARWERVVEREFVAKGISRPDNKRVKGLDTSNGWDGLPRGSTNTTTLGFRPTCTHNRKPVPDVVLDPFAGAGTTGMVAEQLGRKFVGIEINKRYSALAREAA